MESTMNSDWQTYLRTQLSGSGYGRAKLLVDGYKLIFKEETHKRRIVICWYVDGVWKEIYRNPDSGIGRKFGNPMYLKYTKAQIQVTKLLDGLKAAREKAKVKKLIGFSYKYSNPNQIIRKLKTTCQDIKIDNE